MGKFAIITLSVTVLFLFHVNGWNRAPQLTPTAGWLPADITYRILWLGGGCVVLWFVVRLTWKQTRC